MQRFSRLPGSARFSQAAAACELASARHMSVEHCMPSSCWPAQPLVTETTSVALTASPSASWRNIFGLAALPAVQSSSTPVWNHCTPVLPAQAQAAADLAQIQQLSNTEEEQGMLDDSMLCATKRTYQPSVIVRKRRHGFLSRIASRGGRNVIRRRNRKGRYNISA